jgi:hypothetical protein
MAPVWVAFPRPLILVLFTITVAVTVGFKAEVEAQGGAYATGVLGLMLSGAVAATLSLWKEGNRLMSCYCGIVAAVFLYALAGNVMDRPDGLLIAGAFVLLTLTVSGVSRYRRSTELRVTNITFCNAESQSMWSGFVGKKINLVPIKTATAEARARKAEEIRRHYQVQGPLAFLHVFLVDNRSEFIAPLKIEVLREGNDYVINVTGAIAIANTIAYISELLDPIAIFLGLTRQDPMTQSFRFFLLGEGETGMLVYTILLRFWDYTPEDDVRPYIYLMSD